MKESKFNKSIKDEKQIKKIFEKQGKHITEKLLRFQQVYGGLTFYAGLEPIVFGILHTGKRRGIFANSKKN